MDDTGSLSPESEAIIANVRSGVDDLIAQIARLQMTWNHPPRVREMIEPAKAGLERVASDLQTS